MGRHDTQYYKAETNTMFAWADTDNDKFNRELDLYRLAIALEKHDHSAGRGLPIAPASIGAGTVGEQAYQANSIPSTAYKDLSITNPKIANGTIGEEKLAYAPVRRSGDIMTGYLTITNAGGGAPSWGRLSLGNNGSYHQYQEGAYFVTHNANGAGVWFIDMDMILTRQSAPTTGYTFYGSNGFIGYDGTNMVTNTGRIHTDGNTALVPVPLQGSVNFRNAGDLAAAGARWVRDTNCDGRILVGSGATAGDPDGTAFPDYQHFNQNFWRFCNGLGISGGGSSGGGTGTTQADPGHKFFVVSVASNTAGATETNSSAHTHPFTDPSGAGSAPTLTGTQSRVIPPMLSVVWGRRTS